VLKVNAEHLKREKKKSNLYSEGQKISDMPFRPPFRLNFGKWFSWRKKKPIPQAKAKPAERPAWTRETIDPKSKEFDFPEAKAWMQAKAIAKDKEDSRKAAAMAKAAKKKWGWREIQRFEKGVERAHLRREENREKLIELEQTYGPIKVINPQTLTVLYEGDETAKLLELQREKQRTEREEQMKLERARREAERIRAELKQARPMKYRLMQSIPTLEAKISRIKPANPVEREALIKLPEELKKWVKNIANSANPKEVKRHERTLEGLEYFLRKGWYDSAYGALREFNIKNAKPEKTNAKLVKNNVNAKPAPKKTG